MQTNTSFSGSNYHFFPQNNNNNYQTGGGTTTGRAIHSEESEDEMLFSGTTNINSFLNHSVAQNQQNQQQQQLYSRRSSGDNNNMTSTTSNFSTRNVFHSGATTTSHNMTNTSTTIEDSFSGSQGIYGNMYEQPFASMNTFEPCLQNLNQRLSVNGYPYPIEFKKEYVDEKDVKILNVVHLLLKQHQMNVEFRSELNDKMSRLRCDNDSMHLNLSRLKQKYDQVERELHMMRSKERSIASQHLKELKKLEIDKEALQRDVKNMIQKQDQYEHKYQRKEREYNQLKERMQTMINQRSTPVNSRSLPSQKIEIVNLLPNHNSHGTWKNGSARNEDNLYQNIVGAFTDEKNELVSENQLLRESLKSLNAELNQLKQVVYSAKGFSADEDASLTDLIDGQFELPYQMTCDDIEGEMKHKIDQVYQMIQAPAPNKGGSGQDIESLAHLLSSNLSGNAAVEAINLLSNIQQRQSEFKKVMEEQNALLQLNLAQNERNEMDIISIAQPSGKENEAPINHKNNTNSWGSVDKKQMQQDKRQMQLLSRQITKQQPKNLNDHFSNDVIMFDE